MPNLSALLLAAAALLASACSSAPPQLYLLSAPTPAETAAPEGRYAVVGLAELTLPAYGRGEKIVSQGEGEQLLRDDDHRWAEPPEEALTRAVSRALRSRIAASVVAEPFPRGLDPDLRVLIRFDRFLRAADGRSEMAGQFVLMSGDGRAVRRIEAFDIAMAGRGEGYSAYVDAVSRSVDELTARIAAAAQALPEE
ncbi:MAG: PqiC family protein [Caulobacterales bacterium]|nr:PqiC family protein [Caulobacterales bacterium]